MAQLCSRVCLRMIKPTAIRTSQPITCYQPVLQTRYMSAGDKPEDPDMAMDLLFDENFEVKPYVWPRVHPWNLKAVSYRFKRRLRVWFGEMPPESKTKEELQEHNDLMDRLDDCYLEIPQRMPDQQWFLDYIQHCSKYSDFMSAQAIWEWFSSDNMVNHPTFRVSEDVIEKWDEFFETHSPKNLFEMSDAQKERKEKLAKVRLLEDPDFHKRRPLHLTLPDKHTSMTRIP